MKKQKVMKVILLIIAVICLIVVGAYAVWKVYHHLAIKQWTEQRNQRGILLCFDDYSDQTWRDNFDLFDEYGVKVTFFVNVNEPTDFCMEAIERGHEIGFHTKSHVDLTTVSKEEFYEQAIAPIERFREKGYELTSFAYPYGSYQEWMNEELVKYYDTVRGAYYFACYYKESLPKALIEANSIDNIHYDTDQAFREEIGRFLDVLEACDEGTVFSLFSHAISYGDWCVTPERLEILFQEAQKRNIQFYTFKDIHQSFEELSRLQDGWSFLNFNQ